MYTCTHTHTHLLELVGVRREVFPGLLDVHNDVGKDAQSVVVTSVLTMHSYCT